MVERWQEAWKKKERNIHNSRRYSSNFVSTRGMTSFEWGDWKCNSILFSLHSEIEFQ